MSRVLERKEQEQELSPAAKQRLEQGLLCYARPERDGILAICVDLNVHAFGPSLDRARENLHAVVDETLEIAAASGHLEALLAQGPNRATMRDYRATIAIYFMIRTVLGLFRFVSAARDFCASRLFTEWKERAFA